MPVDQAVVVLDQLRADHCRVADLALLVKEMEAEQALIQVVVITTDLVAGVAVAEDSEEWRSVPFPAMVGLELQAAFRDR